MRGPSAFRIVPPAGALSLSELELQFAERRRVEASARAEFAEQYAALRRKYAEQSRRAQDQFADARIKQPGSAALFHLAVESVKASRLVYGALRDAEAALRGGDTLLVPPGAVERAIDWNRQQLERLEGQLRILDLVDGVLVPLRKLFGQLEQSRHMSALGWQSIARHLLSQAGNGTARTSFLALPGFSLKDYLTRAGDGAYGDAFGRGIETVLALAPVLAARRTEPAEADLLAIAALCQDCGLLLLSRNRGTWRGRAVAGDAEPDAHASLGAAVVAGIAELAASLPALVAEHHRRLIAFDRPAALAVQSTGSRLLATTVRFLQLVDETPTNAVGELPQPVLYQAALRLNREADCGEWDRAIAAQLLSALGFQLQYEPPAAGDEQRRGRLDANKRLDPAGEAVPEPNFLHAEEAREDRYVRTTRR